MQQPVTLLEFLTSWDIAFFFGLPLSILIAALVQVFFHR